MSDDVGIVKADEEYSLTTETDNFTTPNLPIPTHGATRATERGAGGFSHIPIYKNNHL